MVNLAAFARTTLDPEVLQSMKVTRVFKDRFSSVNGMDWDREGETLVVSSNDESIQLFPLAKADVSKILHSKKYGVEMVKFCHQGAKQVLCSSRTTTNEKNNAVRLWDLIENKYIRNFTVPAPLVKLTGISMHPFRNLMLTVCQDHVARLFSLDSETPLTSFKSDSSDGFPISNFDKDDLIFSVYNGCGGIRLYDVRKFTEPFNILCIKSLLLTNEHLLSLSFCPSGKKIVFSTNNHRIFSIDSFTGQKLFSCEYDEKESKSICVPIITPDGKYIICGGSNSNIHCWNEQGDKVIELSGHEGPPPILAFNPKRAILASGCVNVAWWQPDIKI